MALKQTEADVAGNALPAASRPLQAAPRRAGARARGRPQVHRRAQQRRPHDHAPQGRGPQAPLPASSTSAATRTASSRRSSASSTTRTARRTSRSCSTRTANAATSSRQGRRCRRRAAVRCRLADPRRQCDAPAAHPGRIAGAHVELKPGKGGQIARAAGSPRRSSWPARAAYATVRLRSGETRKVHVDCRATIGEIGNDEHNLRKFGKAGAKRWRGIRPTVRGVVMNPVDHPHGGGEGRSGGQPAPGVAVGLAYQGQRRRATTSVPMHSSCAGAKK